MKKHFGLWYSTIIVGIIALVGVIGFSMTACDDGNGKKGNTGDGLPALSWTNVAGSGSYIWSIAWSGSKFAAVGGNSAGSSGAIRTSADGVTWSSSGTNFIDTGGNSAGFPDYLINDVTWGGPAGSEKFWMAGSYRVASSSDGVAWAYTTNEPCFGTATVLNGIAWGSPSGTDRVVLVGKASGGAGIFYSDDGAAWTEAHTASTDPNPFGSSNANKVAWGAGKFVAVGDSGKIAYSADGIAWTAAANSTFGTTKINNITFGGASGQEKFVAVGNDGRIAHSPDGITWTAVGNSTFGTTGLTSVIYDVSWGKDRFVAVGGAGGHKIAVSANGTAWTASTHALGDNILSVAYGAARFILGGGQTQSLAYSNTLE